MRSIWRVLCLLALMFCVSVISVHAQPATGSSKLAWDQAAPDLATAEGYGYRYYSDGQPMAVILAGVTCVGTASPFTCSAPFPAYPPGPHTIQLTASNAAGESLKSAPLAFVFVVVPAVPTNLRILE